MTAAAESVRPALPPLTGSEKALLGLAVILGVGVGGLGLISSFDTVSAAGARWGFATPQMLPIGIDAAIPAFTLVNLLLIRMDMPLGWVRFVPWALTGVTCWLNIAAGHSLSAKLAHGTMPLLWVVLSEVAAHVYASRIGAVTGRRMEKIRRSRWILAPLSTFGLWRRMTLWEVTSYSEALAREKERQLARADLREQYGRKWRSKTPRRERVMLRMGDLAPVTEETTPAPPPADTPAPLVDAKPRPRRQPATKDKAKTQRTFEELLTEARTVTAEWTETVLTADRIRTAVHCSATNARALRDALKAERADGRPLHSVDDAEGEATEAEAA